MSDFWAYFTDPAYRDTLTWLGGGLVVLAGGIWAVIRFFAEPEMVRADRGGVAAKRDAIGNTTNYHEPPKP